MQYKLYRFTGVTCCDGTAKSISLEKVIKDYPEFFMGMHSLPVDPRFNTPWYAVTTWELFDDNSFCFEADDVEMECIQDCIEKGLVIVPFSRTYFVMDLIPYYEQGLNVVFMAIKDYKRFKKDYEDSLVTVEDKSNRGLF